MMKRGDTFWESDKKQSIGGNEMNYDSDSSTRRCCYFTVNGTVFRFLSFTIMPYC